MQRFTDGRYPGQRRFGQLVAMAAVAAIAAGTLAALALARTQPTLSLAKGVAVQSRTDNVVANSRGMTVYTLSGETTHHLKCTKANQCFSFWFPVKTRSSNARLSAAHGVKGKLGTLHRNGFHQVTLAGHPLYTFAGDAGQTHHAAGQGIVSFGGTWHVVAMSSSPAPTMTGPTSTTTPTTTSTTTPSPYYP